MVSRKMTIDNGIRYVKKIIIRKLNKLKVLNQTREKMFQSLKNQSERFFTEK